MKIYIYIYFSFFKILRFAQWFLKIRFLYFFFGEKGGKEKMIRKFSFYRMIHTSKKFNFVIVIFIRLFPFFPLILLLKKLIPYLSIFVSYSFQRRRSMTKQIIFVIYTDFKYRRKKEKKLNVRINGTRFDQCQLKRNDNCLE